MEIHHTKHHAGYVSKLNAAVKDTPFANLPLRQLMRRLMASDTALRNNGGGHYNHSLFWNAINWEAVSKQYHTIPRAIPSSPGKLWMNSTTLWLPLFILYKKLIYSPLKAGWVNWLLRQSTWLKRVYHHSLRSLVFPKTSTHCARAVRLCTNWSVRVAAMKPLPRASMICTRCSTVL